LFREMQKDNREESEGEIAVCVEDNTLMYAKKPLDVKSGGFELRFTSGLLQVIPSRDLLPAGMIPAADHINAGILYELVEVVWVPPDPQAALLVI
jgi:hypothetical protein